MEGGVISAAVAAGMRKRTFDKQLTIRINAPKEKNYFYEPYPWHSPITDKGTKIRFAKIQKRRILPNKIVGFKTKPIPKDILRKYRINYHEWGKNNITLYMKKRKKLKEVL